MMLSSPILLQASIHAPTSLLTCCKYFSSSSIILQSSIRGRFHKSWAHGANIEIALLKLGARRKARSTPVKSFSKVGRKAQIGRKTVYEIDPWLLNVSLNITVYFPLSL